MEKPTDLPKKKKKLSREELLDLDKETLIEKYMQLEAHNIQLKNILNKHLSEDSEKEKSYNKKTQREFDYTKSHFRRCLLQVMYFGWDYQGLAVQEHTNQTIEHHVFGALTRACLIHSRETSEYHRCGRTDKGVSSFGQIFSISLRSKFAPEEQHLESSIANEMNYCKILNRILPKEIRVVAWMPIPADQPDFSARFSCKKRQYRYYFPRSDLNIDAMMSSCTRLLGSHDFRHLCKMDVGNGVVEFRRHIKKADIVAVDDSDTDKRTSMFYLLIEGNAFLWHQIRCIMGILLLVGKGLETPDIIDELLNVEKNPRKPQYSMALDIPLNLFHCTFDINENWVYEEENLRTVVEHLQGEWTISAVKTTMMKDCLNTLEEKYKQLKTRMEDGDSSASERDIMSHSECLLQGVKSKIYKSLLTRETCSSLEERIKHYKKRRKIDVIEPSEK